METHIYFNKLVSSHNFASNHLAFRAMLLSINLNQSKPVAET